MYYPVQNLRQARNSYGAGHTVRSWDIVRSDFDATRARATCGYSGSMCNRSRYCKISHDRTVYLHLACLISLGQGSTCTSEAYTHAQGRPINRDLKQEFPSWYLYSKNVSTYTGQTIAIPAVWLFQKKSITKAGTWTSPGYTLVCQGADNGLLFRFPLPLPLPPLSLSLSLSPSLPPSLSPSLSLSISLAPSRSPSLQGYRVCSFRSCIF